MKTKGIKRIAVLGGNNAGKTVFITSLIDNLQYFCKDTLTLGDEWCVYDARITNEGKVGDLERFPQEKYRQTLFGAEWPRKTFSASIACLDVKLQRTKSKWYRKDVVVRKLEIVDIAGERTADFGMIKRTFREWSLMLTNQFVCSGIDWESRFDKITLTSGADKADILNAYRDVLVDLYAKGANASITPSTARITLEGLGLGGKPEEYRKKLQEHPIGLEGNEFAPLPESVFCDSNFEQLVKEFESAYDEYKSKIVMPIWSWLKRADDVIYLVDVPGILANGTFAYNAERDLAKGCFGAICNAWRMEESLLKKGKEWLKAKMEGCHFSRLIEVATKADLVNKDTRDNTKELVKRLLERVVNVCGFDKMEAFYCAAVRADGKSAQGKAPDKWDEEWDVGKYVFDMEKPPIKRLRNDIAPANFQLGAIAKMILNLD